jgi:hypothetical protein
MTSNGAGERPFPLEPTPIHVPDDVLADLQRRLDLTRWPDDAGNEDGYYGVRRAYLQELVDHWRTSFDWRAAEAAINAYEHYRVEVDGVPVHFMRRAGVGPDPTPLILTRGWPWTSHQRVGSFLATDRAGWYNHVNLTAHDRGGHFIPWEVPDLWVEDLRRTFRGRR